MRRALLPVLVLIAFIALWEMLAQTGALASILGIKESVSDRLVPAPSAVAESLWEDRGILASNGWVTLVEILAGFALSVVAGVAFALFLHAYDPLRRAFYPLLVASQTIPIVTLAPILVIWLGFGIAPKIAIIAFWGFFPVTVNTFDGLRGVNPAAIRMMRTLDASRFTIIRRLELPAALPKLLSGARIAAVVAVIGAVFAELAGANEGLGHLITQAQASLLSARVFAAVVVLSAFAIALFGLISLIERRFAWWGDRGIG
jgi:NitT/TauT family transport system permease protein/putative hydroxymethylpyrimidine transport system permease protein